MKKVGIFLNLAKDQAISVAKDIIAWLEKHQIELVLDRAGAEALGYPLARAEETLYRDVDCLLVLGGDGTLLSCARAVAGGNVPLLGINLGQLGFLTETEIPGIIQTLDNLLRGEYQIEERIMLQAQVVRENKIIEDFLSLNDVVITKGAFARLIKLGIYINDEYISTYPADGLIISSPTGSTAYSLSAGGPIVAPNLDLMVITPICPHTLNSRPLVISAANQVKVDLKSNQGEVMLTLDGQHGFFLQPGDEVLVQRADATAKFIKLKGRSFFEVLRAKLREGGRAEQ